MPGRKDKKKDRGEKPKGGGGLASFLGVGGMPEFNDEDLEAELLAMTGGGVSKGKKKGSSSGGGGASLADIDKMLSSAHKLGEETGEGDDDEDDDMDVDDADLLAELEGMEDDDDEGADDSMEITVERPPVRQKPTPPAPVKPAGKTSSSNNLQIVNERLSAYRSASAAAKAKGETSKVRRYERAIGSMNEMVKDLKAGKRVNMEELPPEVFVPSGGGGGGGASGSGSLASKGKPQTEKVDDDEFAELAEWAGISTDKGKAEVAAPKATPSADISLISERLKMYQEGLKAAETAGDSSKIRRYKRSVETLTSLQKDAKSGRHVDMETIPPVINVPVNQTTPTSSKPVSKTTPAQTGNLIDLDDPEFDEFNLSEEDMAAMMASLPEQNKPVTTPTRPPPIQATPPKVQSVPMKPKPQAPPPPAPKPQTMPASSRPPGLIDLDTPEFAEFDLSEEDMELLASQLDMSKNVQKTPPTATSAATPPVVTPPRETTQSLPTKMVRPVGMGGPVTKEQVLLVLRERKDQYMTAVRSAKAKGDASGTKQYGSVAIQFDKAIKSIEQGQPIDLSGTPPPPPGFTSNYNYDISKYKSATPAPAAMGTAPQSAQGGGGEGDSDPGIPVPKTPLEGLQQRLDKYKEGLKLASDKGESSRVRRLGRIIKQYEEAIRDTKAGKFVNFEELPAPPGYPPIPSAPRAQSRPAQSLPPSRVSQPSGAGGRVKLSVNEGQIRALKQRGAEFQRAAREAKAKGDKEKALGYLRYYKGIEPMIAAAESGYPVDMTQVPPSPYSDPSKATASKGVLSHLEKAKEGDEDTFDLIEKQLEEQKDICSENAKVYEKLVVFIEAAAYRRALSEGEVVNVAYSRVLFLGTAGVGKSSFKNSLMKLPWDPKANSTIISDISCVRPFAKGLLNEQWEAVTHEAEIEAMAHLFSAASKEKKYRSILNPDDVTTAPTNNPTRRKLDFVLGEVSKIQVVQPPRQLEPHLLLHFWDCGGQPAFLEILPVFLTSRTTFLLHFDASKDLNSKWKSVHHIDGARFDGEEVNVSTLSYMLNWMACVHSHLMKYGADGSISDYPRMFCIGTHGDLLTNERKEQVKIELISHYKNKEYVKLISDTLIIDNTSSGKGESEDPNIEVVRRAIIEITKYKLIVKTPISWVLFCKVLQALEENIVSISQAEDVGAACNISPEDVPQVLLFYHDLGAVLYYPQLEGLKEKVIVDPKFFIDALGKIFTFQASTTHEREWEIFHQYGILIQPLYTSVWKECGDLKPEDFIEVLLHFRLAAQVIIEDQDICSSRYKQYFIPAILKLCQDNTIATHSKEVEVASPLHIKFETGFVPPGFFTRFVAVIAAHPNTTLYLEEGVYRNRVTFRYQEERNRSIEHLTVTDQHDAIQINVHRPASHSDPVPLANVCQDILVLLEDSAKEVENILQNCIGRGFEELPKYSVSRSLRYICDDCPVSSKLHYLTPAKYQTSYLEVTCRVNTTYQPLTEKEKIWFTEKVPLKAEDQLHKTIIPDLVSVTTQKSPIGIFESHFPQLCDAIATEHNITRVSSHCISLISDDVFDEAIKTTNPVYERAQALLRELRRHLKASSDQHQYLLNLISIFHKIKDPILSQIADSMKSELYTPLCWDYSYLEPLGLCPRVPNTIQLEN
uniref:DM14 domain-containing protein n=2 Tax=Amphimedon queenslandica TaxID=400682 RepID=A0A1X7V9C6_AMPQE